MELQKNEVISPKSSFVPRWKMKNLHEGICDFLRRDVNELIVYSA